MNPFSADDLRRLAAPQVFPCVSFYMPTHRADTRQDLIRLRNGLREADARLLAAGLRSPEAAALLTPGHAVLEDSFFWRHADEGLALFLAPGFVRSYALPRAFTERLVIGERFHLKPLWPLLSEAGPFYVLALSQKSVRLWHGTRYALEPVPVEQLPASLTEARLFEPLEHGARLRLAEAAGPGHGGNLAFGNMPEEPFKEELTQFCQRVDAGVREVLHAAPAPLVLAGVDYVLDIYRGVCQYAQLAPGAVAGNPERLDADELRRRAWEVVAPLYRRETAEAAARFRALRRSARAASALRPILDAAAAGRVEVLFVAQGQVQWGRFDEATGAVHEHAAQEPDDEDLLDRAALQVHLTGGRVYAVPPEVMPEPAPLAAVLRY